MPICSIATLAVAQNMRELYRLVLIDTPLAPYFSECITSEVSSTLLLVDGRPDTIGQYLGGLRVAVFCAEIIFFACQSVIRSYHYLEIIPAS